MTAKRDCTTVLKLRKFMKKDQLNGESRRDTSLSMVIMITIILCSLMYLKSPIHSYYFNISFKCVDGDMT